MRKHEFTLIIEGDLDDESVLHALYEAGCDDATFGIAGGIPYADFHRKRDSFRDALLSAIGEVESVDGLKVVHVEPDDVVTVAAAAKRLGKSRQYVNLLANGEKGKGDFPRPVSHFVERSKLWRWSDVAAWAGLLNEADRERAQIIAATNAALDLRRLRSERDLKDVLEAVGI